MNQREMEKQIWSSLHIMAAEFYQFDSAEFERLRNGHQDDNWDYPDAQPLTTEKHQERFDKALIRVTEIIQRKVA